MTNFWERDEVVDAKPGQTISKTTDRGATTEVIALDRAPWESKAQADERKAEAKRALLEEIGRQVGLTVRAGVQGALSLPGVVSDAVTGLANRGLDAVRGEGRGFRFQSVGSAASDLMDRAGLPQPQGSTERVVQDAAAGMAGVVPGVAAAKALAAGGNAVAQRVGTELAKGPGLQTASGAGSGAAQGAARESGAGEGAQAAAAVTGALAPALAPTAAAGSVRRAIRGNEQGRQAMAARLKDAEQSGVDLTLGQASDNGVIRGLETVLASTPGGSGIMREMADAQNRQMDQAIKAAGDLLSPGADAVQAGKAITRGLEGFKAGFKRLQARLYDSLDEHIPANTPVAVGATRGALAKLTEGIPGAPNLSAFFRNQKVGEINAALLDDLALNAEQGGQQALPFEAIKKLRTLVGNELADHNWTSDVPRSKWQDLYTAISADLGRAAQAAGPEALEKWRWANNFNRNQIGRMEQLRTVIERDTPERVFQAAIGEGDRGYTQVRRVMTALPKNERAVVAAAVLQRMGRAASRDQDAAGDAFSSEAFLSNFAAMNPGTRKALFGTVDAKEVLPKVEQVARLAEARRGSGWMLGDSQSAQVRADQAGLAGAAAAGTAALAGHPGALAAAGAGVGAARLLAKGTTSKTVQDFAAQTTELPAGAAAAMVRAGDVSAGPQLQGSEWWADDSPASDAELGDHMRRQGREQLAQAQTVDEAIAGALQATASSPTINLKTEPQAEPQALQPRPVQLDTLVPMSRRAALVSGATFASQDEAQAAARYAGIQSPSIEDLGGVWSVQPQAGDERPVLWSGKRGDGYQTREDAEQAIKRRQEARPDLRWEVLQVGDRFMLQGSPDPELSRRHRITQERARILQESAQAQAAARAERIRAERERLGLADVK